MTATTKGFEVALTTLHYPENLSLSSPRPAMPAYFLARAMDFSEAEVVIPLNDQRTAQVTVSVFDPLVRFLKPYSTMLWVRYRGKMVFWGVVTKPDFLSGGEDKVVIPAVDRSLTMQAHYFRRGDDVLIGVTLVNNRTGAVGDDRTSGGSTIPAPSSPQDNWVDYDNMDAGQERTWGSIPPTATGYRRMLYAARIDQNTAPGVPDVGVVVGSIDPRLNNPFASVAGVTQTWFDFEDPVEPSWADTPGEDLGIKVQRGDEVWQAFTDMGKVYGAPDFELAPVDTVWRSPSQVRLGDIANPVSRFQWANTTADVRALQSPDTTFRRSTTAYADPTLPLVVILPDGYAGDLYLYMVDWDTTARRQTVTVDDTHTVTTRTINADFSGGAWVKVPIDVSPHGAVTVTITKTAGVNAVLQGFFLGAAPGAPDPGTGFITGVQGSWVGVYGTDAYLLLGYHADVGTIYGDVSSLMTGSGATADALPNLYYAKLNVYDSIGDQFEGSWTLGTHPPVQFDDGWRRDNAKVEYTPGGKILNEAIVLDSAGTWHRLAFAGQSMNENGLYQEWDSTQFGGGTPHITGALESYGKARVGAYGQPPDFFTVTPNPDNVLDASNRFHYGEDFGVGTHVLASFRRVLKDGTHLDREMVGRITKVTLKQNSSSATDVSEQLEVIPRVVDQNAVTDDSGIRDQVG